MKKFLFIFALVAILPITFYGQTKSGSKAQAVIDKLRTQFVEAYNSQNADAIAAFYADNATYIGTGGDVVQGKEKIRMGLKGEVSYFKNFVATPAEFGGDKNLAYERGTYSATLAIPNQPAQIVGGKYLLIFRRQKDKTWKIQVQMVSRNRT